MKGVLLETEHLVIRRLTEADFDDLVELDSDPAVVRFITGGAPEFEAGMLRYWLDQYERWSRYGTFAAIERSSHRFLGWFHLRPEDLPDEPELGYRLRRDAWGQGHASEGSRGLIDLAFDELEADRVWATTMAINAASRRVMEKAGMRLVRTFRADWPYPIPGDEFGDVEYAVTRDEWRAARSATPSPGP